MTPEAELERMQRLAEHLLAKVLLDDQWHKRCEVTASNGRGRCSGQAVAVRWEDGFADMVCDQHAATAWSRGALVVRPRPADGTS